MSVCVRWFAVHARQLPRFINVCMTTSSHRLELWTKIVAVNVTHATCSVVPDVALCSVLSSRLSDDDANHLVVIMSRRHVY